MRDVEVADLGLVPHEVRSAPRHVGAEDRSGLFVADAPPRGTLLGDIGFVSSHLSRPFQEALDGTLFRRRQICQVHRKVDNPLQVISSPEHQSCGNEFFRSSHGRQQKALR